ncbi:mitochondrial ribosomal protein S25-domain-containing protein [Polychytrium aggregatum]|uniref:mitochondrial ribosomal protein S25-domain-containing protein n=1 Tax=Polychytrium aggregatum TaxID=110093 RepID=UPI0022FF304C|nr:mitochondrial ribosomal protein S25-domain-containing protein [Polychytrium aggregatum]KAI9205198.1 mitochondrial ribosomal protein S25-domain-containing protein [Polychytrium aggregatum]
MRAPPKTVKLNPLRIIHFANRSLAAKAPGSAESAQPKWMSAVKMFPPSASFVLKTVIPSEVGQFVDQEEVQRTRLSQVNSVSLVHRSKPKKPQYADKPPVIVYPEDRLREDFYKHHPFELSKPFNLVEDTQALGFDRWETINPDAIEFSADNIFKRAQYLMQNQKLKEEEAYFTAVSEFYRVRRMQDTAEASARKEEIAKQIQKIEAEERAKAEAEATRAAAESPNGLPPSTPGSTAQRYNLSLRNSDRSTAKTLSHYRNSRDSLKAQVLEQTESDLAKRKITHPHTTKFMEWEAQHVALSAKFAEKQAELRRLREEANRQLSQFDQKNQTKAQ